MDRVFLGIDIGGQTIKGIAIGEDGIVKTKLALPTKATEGARAVVGVLGDVVDGLTAERRALSVGVGTPGAVDAHGRIASIAVNIPGWDGTDIKSFIEGKLGVPVSVRNDGNLAAYAEWSARGGRSSYLLFVGLGTGIGGGYIEDGKILGGVDDRALEIGHVIVWPGGRLCACGKRGCAEAYASGPAVVKNAFELAKNHDSPLSRMILGLDAGGRQDRGDKFDKNSDRLGISAEKVTPETVYEAFSKGDELAVAVDSLVADTLAKACATAIAILAPDCVVLGGGLMRGAPNLVKEVAERVGGYVYADALKGLTFEGALCGQEAGLWGAALYGASAVLERVALFKLARSTQIV